MIPEIEILSSVRVNWTSLKATMDRALNERPDRIISQCPVTFSKDAEFLIYLAALNKIPINNLLNVLRTLPHNLLEYLHYNIMIACDEVTCREFQESTRLQLTIKQVNYVYFILVTGSMAEWYDTIVLNLTRDWGYSINTRILMDKLLTLFERQGLQELFSKYGKRKLSDDTFLLEHK